jgi:hypothetical protein
MRPAIFIFVLAVLIMLTACSSYEAVSRTKGREQVFDASYGTVTNKLSALKLNPSVASYSGRGHEVVPGRSYEWGIPEEPPGDVSSLDTTIIVTRIDAQSTRVEIKTIRLGTFSSSHDRRIEQQRLNELAQLLSNQGR